MRHLTFSALLMLQGCATMDQGGWDPSLLMMMQPQPAYVGGQYFDPYALPNALHNVAVSYANTQQRWQNDMEDEREWLEHMRGLAVGRSTRETVVKAFGAPRRCEDGVCAWQLDHWIVVIDFQTDMDFDSRNDIVADFTIHPGAK